MRGTGSAADYVDILYIVIILIIDKSWKLCNLSGHLVQLLSIYLAIINIVLLNVNVFCLINVMEDKTYTAFKAKHNI